MSILDKLAAHARERVLADSENMSLDILQAMCREKGRANGTRSKKIICPSSAR